MNKIHCNEDPLIKSKDLSDTQIQMFLNATMQEKKDLLEMWVPGHRSYVTWTIHSDNPGFDGLNGMIHKKESEVPPADIPENWMEIQINKPR